MSYQEIAIDFKDELEKVLHDYNENIAVEDANEEDTEVYWYELHQQLLVGRHPDAILGNSSLQLVGLGATAVVVRSTKHQGLVYAHFVDDTNYDSRIMDLVHYKYIGPDLYSDLEGNPIQDNVVKIYYHDYDGVLMEDLSDYVTMAQLDGEEYMQTKVKLFTIHNSLARMGYIHQDLHGENVMVNKQGHVKIIDLMSVIKVDFNRLLEVADLASNSGLIELANILYLGSRGSAEDEANEYALARIDFTCPILERYKEIKEELDKRYRPA